MAEGNSDFSLTEEQIKYAKKAFDQFDKKKQGFISTNDLDNAFRSIHISINPELLKEWADIIDEEATGTINYEAFMVIYRKKVQEDADVRELKEAFRILDKQKKGEIEADHLRWILKGLHEDITDEELDIIIHDIDTDGSGTVDFEEFYKLMKSD